MVREVPRKHWWVLPVFGAAAAALLGSWLYTPTREWWDALDVATFRLLNDSLEGRPGWQVLWAAANHRAADLVPLTLMLWLLSRWVFGDDGLRAARRSAVLVAAACFMVIGRQVARLEFFDIDRRSPTRVLDDVFRLSELVPWIDAKDGSGHSFPGDHCLFLMMLAIFLWRSAGWHHGLAGGAAVVVFSMPRLVGGAHWLTDDLIGSSVVALLVMGVFYGTPIHRVATGWIEPLTAWALERWQLAARRARASSSAAETS